MIVHPDDRAAMEEIPHGENVDQVFSCCRTPEPGIWHHSIDRERSGRPASVAARRGSFHGSTESWFQHG
jgi:hypothetical protein